MAAKAISIDRLLRVLADPTRLRILNLMRDQEVCVCYFVEVLETSQPKISRHLAYLRRAGLVAARRSGYWMRYRMVIPQDRCAARILGEVLDCMRGLQQGKRDLTRLEAACCAPEKFVRLEGAPRPVEIKRGAGG
ncbi:MAG: ArsR/SmtB family transcription factor [Terriglobales bacterium]